MSALLTGIIVSGALVAFGLAIARLVSGPTQADRVVALDVVFSSNIALTAAAALAVDSPWFLDVGLGLALVGFVATISWARLIDASPRREDPPPIDGGEGTGR